MNESVKASKQKGMFEHFCWRKTQILSRAWTSVNLRRKGSGDYSRRGQLFVRTNIMQCVKGRPQAANTEHIQTDEAGTLGGKDRHFDTFRKTQRPTMWTIFSSMKWNRNYDPAGFTISCRKLLVQVTDGGFLDCPLHTGVFQRVAHLLVIIGVFQDEVDSQNPVLRDNPQLQEEVKGWLKDQKVQEIFMQGKFSLFYFCCCFF